MNNSKSIDQYLEDRSRFGRENRHSDDRCDDRKQWADAVLRGKLGCDRANQIIDAIDRIRSYR